MTSVTEFHQASIEALECGSFPNNSERCYFLIRKSKDHWSDDINQIPKVVVSSFQELWEKYFEETGEEKPLKKPSPAGEEGYQKALIQLIKNPKRGWVPIRLTADTFLIFGLMGLKDDYFNASSEVISTGRSGAVSSRPEKTNDKKTVPLPVETKKSLSLRRPVDVPKSSQKALPQLVLIHTPERKAWPYGLLGDTKNIKEFLKFPDEGERISMYVKNMNKQFGPGWNLKEEAVEKIRDVKGEMLELFEFASVEEYVAYVNED